MPTKASYEKTDDSAAVDVVVISLYFYLYVSLHTYTHTIVHYEEKNICFSSHKIAFIWSYGSQ